MCKEVTKAPVLWIPSVATGAAVEVALLEVMFSHVLSPESYVYTQYWPSARFHYVHPNLIMKGDLAQNRTSLLRYLGRIVSNDSRRQSATRRFVEPGVGRTALLDDLVIRQRQDMTDFSVLGIGLTQYGEHDFILKGPDIDGRCSLEKAIYRHRVSQELEMAGCRTPITAAILSLPGLYKLWPDGRRQNAALLVRGARMVARVQQLDPLHGFFHSRLFGAVIQDYLRERAVALGSNLRVSCSDSERIAERSFRHYDIRPIVDQDRYRNLAASSIVRLAMFLRWMEIRNYAPVLINIAKRKVSRELDRDPERESVTDYEYACWFAERMAEQMAIFYKMRCVFDYRKARNPRIANALHESQVSLMAELHDLDTAMVTTGQLQEAVLLTQEQLRNLRTDFGEYHAVEVREALGIVRSLSLVALCGNMELVRSVITHFDKVYFRRAGQTSITNGVRWEASKVRTKGATDPHRI
jgi:hypothetical protein